MRAIDIDARGAYFGQYVKQKRRREQRLLLPAAGKTLPLSFFRDFSRRILLPLYPRILLSAERVNTLFDLTRLRAPHAGRPAHC